MPVLDALTCDYPLWLLQGESDRLAQYLFTNGITALSYHAGKTPAERSKAQSLFLSNRVRVVVATVAFGMGLDKSDVSAVVNVGLPRSIEAYVQQVRAARCAPHAARLRCISCTAVAHNAL
jgi:ATP-dependent DNA helicase Q4